MYLTIIFCRRKTGRLSVSAYNLNIALQESSQ
jgi:hypothetical protein